MVLGLGCGRFRLVLGFLAILSLGPFLLPFVTLLVGICACRRGERATVVAGVLVALLGIAAAFAGRSTPSC